MVRRSEPQIGPVVHPVPHIEIETFPLPNPFLDPFWKVGMAKEDDFESLQKFLVCKGPKRCGILPFAIGVVDLMTLAAHLQRDSVAQGGPASWIR